MIHIKYSELTKQLRSIGCYILRHGSNHDMWYSPITEKKFPVPRHQSEDVKKGTLKCIKRDAGL